MSIYEEALEFIYDTYTTEEMAEHDYIEECKRIFGEEYIKREEFADELDCHLRKYQIIFDTYSQTNLYIDTDHYDYNFYGKIIENAMDTSDIKMLADADQYENEDMYDCI